jgi:hypothetical protein
VDHAGAQIEPQRLEEQDRAVGSAGDVAHRRPPHTGWHSAPPVIAAAESGTLIAPGRLVAVAPGNDVPRHIAGLRERRICRELASTTAMRIDCVAARLRGRHIPCCGAGISLAVAQAYPLL